MLFFVVKESFVSVFYGHQIFKIVKIISLLGNKKSRKRENTLQIDDELRTSSSFRVKRVPSPGHLVECRKKKQKSYFIGYYYLVVGDAQVQCLNRPDSHSIETCHVVHQADS